MKESFPVLLFLVFLVLKLTHVIAWSWLWVTCPLWASFALSGVFVVAVWMFALSAVLFSFVDECSSRRSQCRRP
jgi:hypothetical protein